MRANLDPNAEGVEPDTDSPWGGWPYHGGIQGDPLSSLGWVVFLDTLLTAVNKVQREFPFYLRHSRSPLIPQLPVCYADDLHNIGSCREATVKANYIISAFAAMFGIEFASEKLKAITSGDPGEITLYNREWIPFSQPFEDTESLMKSLGILISLDLTWADQYSAMETKLKTVAELLGPRNASIPAKAMAIGMSTIPQVLFPLQFYSFSRKQHAELSAILIRPLRSAKMVGSRIHKSILTNSLLGGFMEDVHAMV
jgi:hypothetical protein